jgi:FkbH-like protein
VRITEPFLALQRFFLQLQEQGVLLCLCSRNEEVDVTAVFEQRPEMLIKLDQHVVQWRINWSAKSENIREMCRGLSLGLDSVVFVDDSPYECAEVHHHHHHHHH